MEGMVHTHPKYAYAGLQKSLKQDLASMLCTTQGLVEDFKLV